ncbi:MAG: MFS transporter [Gammaproteobacteria bacterium]|nr:MFS transporter [Gammaproteobacteria bacterium]
MSTWVHRQRLSTRHKVLWAFGTFGVSLSYEAFIGWVQFFYLDVLRLAPLAMTWAWVLYTLWNMVNDPIAGQLSDRTSTRWGRRIPWIMGLAIPLGISFALIWTPPAGLGLGLGGGLWWYFLIAICVFDAMFSAITINYVALFPAMYPEQGPRAAVAGWRQGFAILGVIVGVTFAKSVADAVGWAAMGVLFGALASLAFFISLGGSFEPARTSVASDVPFKTAVRMTLRSGSFRWFLVMSTTIEFTLIVLPAVVPLFAKYVLGESDGLRQGLISGVAFVVAIPSFALWTWAAKRWESRSAIIVALGLFGILLIPLGVVRSYDQALIAAAGLGVGLAGLLMLREVMLADVIDEDAARHGVRREGMFFGMHGFVIRAAFAFQGTLIGGMLAITGYDPALVAQPQNVALGLRILISGAPLIAVLIAVYAARRYSLHGERLAAVKAATP